MGVSLKPSKAITVTGLLDDVDVKITEAKFQMFDYGGSTQPVPALKLALDAMDGSSPLEQYWSMGKATDWMPSDDGKELVPIGRATELTDSTNGMILLTSLINAGFPESKLDDDISILEGLECHINRVAAPTRKGLQNDKGKDKTILTITKIIKLPWDADAKPKTKSKPKTNTITASKSKSKPSTKSDDAADIDALTTEFLVEVLSDEDLMRDYPDGLPKNKIAPEAIARLKSDNPHRSKILQKAFDDTFLNSGPWTYDSGKLSLG